MLKFSLILQSSPCRSAFVIKLIVSMACCLADWLVVTWPQTLVNRDKCRAQYGTRKSVVELIHSLSTVSVSVQIVEKRWISCGKQDVVSIRRKSDVIEPSEGTLDDM